MQPSAALCRAQGAIQLARAESSDLDNVQRLASAAAAAWFKEADDADSREARRECVKARAAQIDLLGPHSALEEGMSENPDRGRPSDLRAK